MLTPDKLKKTAARAQAKAAKEAAALAEKRRIDNEKYEAQCKLDAEARLPLAMDQITKLLAEAALANKRELNFSFSYHENTTDTFVLELMRDQLIAGGFKADVKRHYNEVSYNRDYGCDVGGDHWNQLRINW